jgi:hypothetical protein
MVFNFEEDDSIDAELEKILEVMIKHSCKNND